MKKVFLLLNVIGIMLTSPVVGRDTDGSSGGTPCFAGYEACTGAGGSSVACEAGYWACICAMYGLGC